MFAGTGGSVAKVPLFKSICTEMPFGVTLFVTFGSRVLAPLPKDATNP
jgi:hypothetical protein